MYVHTSISKYNFGPSKVSEEFKLKNGDTYLIIFCMHTEGYRAYLSLNLSNNLNFLFCSVFTLPLPSFGKRIPLNVRRVLL